jgi:phage terminase large subunit
MFSRTTAINKLLALKKRKRVIQGGTWAGKTYGIMACIIDDCAKHDNELYTIVAESIPALKAGALRFFLEIMMGTNRWIADGWNGSDRKYVFSGTKSIIEFQSFDSVDKAQAHGKRTGLFLNEAPAIPFPIADALIGRTSGTVWYDYNPRARSWVHDEIIGQPDTDFIILLPSDNEALPETIKQEHEAKKEKAKTSTYWANWCRVYLDGEIGSVDGLVFPEYELIDELPKNIPFAYGMDFGFAADPTTLILVAEKDDVIYCDELIYRNGLMTNELSGIMKSLNIKNYIYADSSDPRMIEDIHRYGFNIKPCIKGQDSVFAGINYIRERKLKVTKRSLNLIRELNNYMFIQDKNGKMTNEPCDAFNHCIDAIRYACYTQHKTARKINKLDKNNTFLYQTETQKQLGGFGNAGH